MGEQENCVVFGEAEEKKFQNIARQESIQLQLSAQEQFIQLPTASKVEQRSNRPAVYVPGQQK